jgi:hypothetical protein
MLGWRLPRRLLWRWLVRRRWLLRRLRLWHWLGLRRLWLGRLSWLRLAGRLRVLRVCPDLRQACVRCSGVLRYAGLYHPSLYHAGLHDTGLHSNNGSRNRGPRNHSSGSTGLNGAGLCPGSHDDPYCPDLRLLGKPARGEGFLRYLHAGPDHANLDTASRPDSGSDVLLDAAAEYGLRGRQPVGPGEPPGSAWPRDHTAC